MFKRTVTMMLAAGTLVLGGCASNGGAEQAADNSDFGGKSIYLRGEMNDWMATDESKVVKVADKLRALEMLYKHLGLGDGAKTEGVVIVDSES